MVDQNAIGEHNNGCWTANKQLSVHAHVHMLGNNIQHKKEIFNSLSADLFEASRNGKQQ